ncbi:PepSY-associated TM helix domain-containing protein [Laceyella sacchari]|jgi:uncharacterized iron-regulated membrane protein|uniref:PepSY domain-containing protein n=1 Tax=Laceyella sacchari TaxID=37482 RepID=A0ABY5U229_LACSH|nr:PepSY domain-containing protein [Laceyella sacchari]UWE03684.1 PepSY domain-containing protein [Laceyella sacchari]
MIEKTGGESVSTTVHKPQRLTQLIWRWHFYAGIIFAPFIVMLSITGAVYLFKPQLEDWLYRDDYYIQEPQKQNGTLTPSMQVEAVRKVYPNGQITSYRPSDEPNRTAEVGVMDKGQAITVFVNPYSGRVVGEIKEEERLLEKVEMLHGELMMGTMGDRLVELAACWAMILIITGLYLWWPKEKTIRGALVPRLTKGGRIFRRDTHAVTGVWLSGFAILLILTGLPWSGVAGDLISKLATSTHTGYPAFAFVGGPKPESAKPTKQVADVPWAAEEVPVPESSGEATPLPLERVMEIARANQVASGYTVYFPEGDKGVYTVSLSADKPEDETVLHIDQYSGKVLVRVGFSDYGWMAKAISIGIALHEGRYFGLPNQVIGLVVCLGLVAVAISGLVMWWKRRPRGKLGAPALPKDAKLTRGLTAIVIGLGLLMPLAGLSLLFVFMLDRLVVKRLPVVQRWLGA